MDLADAASPETFTSDPALSGGGQVSLLVLEQFV